MKAYKSLRDSLLEYAVYNFSEVFEKFKGMKLFKKLCESVIMLVLYNVRACDIFNLTQALCKDAAFALTCLQMNTFTNYVFYQLLILPWSLH